MEKLRHLALFVTESCNLACTYCYAANMEGRHMDEALARQAIDLLLGPHNDAEQVELSFWGGEPLLRFDLLRRLVGYARHLADVQGKALRLSVPTNLTLLTGEMIDFFQDSRVQLSLSCDGGERSQGQRLTAGGRSSFPLVLEKLDLVSRRYRGALPGIRMTVSPATVADFYDDVHFFWDRGFEHIYFAPVVETEWPHRYLEVFEEEQLRLADDWARELLEERRRSFATWDKALAYREFIRRGLIEPERRMVCGAGSSMLAVDVHGDIYPCHRFVFYDKAERSHSLGSVTSGPEILVELGIEDLVEESFGTRTRLCRDCEQNSGCVKICPALNHRLCGDVHVVDERLCALAAIEQRVLDHLEAKLKDEPLFHVYVGEHLVELYSPSALSASTMALFARLEEASLDVLADRALEILEQISCVRRVH